MFQKTKQQNRTKPKSLVLYVTGEVMKTGETEGREDGKKEPGGFGRTVPSAPGGQENPSSLLKGIEH